MKTITRSGLPPLTLADACQITSTRVEAVRALEDAIDEIEVTLESSDLLEHYIDETGSWSDEIRPVIDHYHGLQNAYLALIGGTFTRAHDAARFIEPQLKRLKPQPAQLSLNWDLY